MFAWPYLSDSPSAWKKTFAHSITDRNNSVKHGQTTHKYRMAAELTGRLLLSSNENNFPLHPRLWC